MAKKSKESTRNPEPDSLKGWQQIAAFLGQPVSVAQRLVGNVNRKDLWKVVSICAFSRMPF